MLFPLVTALEISLILQINYIIIEHFLICRKKPFYIYPVKLINIFNYN